VKRAICATTRTKMALEERAAALKEQDDADLYNKNLKKDVADKGEEGTGSASMIGGRKREIRREADYF
jgi:hypothetical protein